MSEPFLEYRGRPVEGDRPEGALVLFHGRGADENDLWPLLDILDPERRLAGACPRGPLSMPPGGAHWYAVRQVGYPDPGTFHPTFAAAEGWLASFAHATGVPIERTVLGGFSQGAVMSYSLALGAGRPRPAGIIALSGFMPALEDFTLDLDGLEHYPVAIGHGTQDPIIGVEWGTRRETAARDSRGVGHLSGVADAPHDRPVLPRALADLAARGDPASGE